MTEKTRPHRKLPRYGRRIVLSPERLELFSRSNVQSCQLSWTQNSTEKRGEHIHFGPRSISEELQFSDGKEVTETRSSRSTNRFQVGENVIGHQPITLIYSLIPSPFPPVSSLSKVFQRVALVIVLFPLFALFYRFRCSLVRSLWQSSFALSSCLCSSHIHQLVVARSIP